jgi:hypothetical protein
LDGIRGDAVDQAVCRKSAFSPEGEKNFLPPSPSERTGSVSIEKTEKTDFPGTRIYPVPLPKIRRAIRSGATDFYSLAV